MKVNIKNLTARQLQEWLEANGYRKFRGRQIQDWLYHQYADDFSAMQNLPAKLREQLDNCFFPVSISPVEEQVAEDGTVKYLMALKDKNNVETVVIPAGDRTAVCISSQVGCPVGCSFCASGKGGLERNLEAAEIVDQVIFACRRLGGKIDNVVVMGVGEPLLNPDNLISALHTLTDPQYLNLGARRITVSTSGIVPGIKKLAEEGKQWNLAVSLHGTNDSLRARFIPERFRYPVNEILSACQYYHELTGRMVYFEYTLLKDFNDSEKDAKALAGHARKVKAKINLIPCNSGGNQKWQSPDFPAVKRFQQILKDQGVSATLRQRRGNDIQAACGQLRSDRSLYKP